MLSDHPLIEDAISEMEFLALTRPGLALQTRQSVANVVSSLREVPGAAGILANVDSSVRSNLITEIGFGVKPSNLIALLDLLDRANLSWITVRQWIEETQMKQESEQRVLFRQHLNKKHTSEILDFHHHQHLTVRYNTRTAQFNHHFIYLLFTVFDHDRASAVLRHWSTNLTTGMLIDLVKLADNWDQVKDFHADWGLSLLGITQPTKSKDRV